MLIWRIGPHGQVVVFHVSMKGPMILVSNQEQQIALKVLMEENHVYKYWVMMTERSHRQLIAQKIFNTVPQIIFSCLGHLGLIVQNVLKNQIRI